jgi:hypothetical protein
MGSGFIHFLSDAVHFFLANDRQHTFLANCLIFRFQGATTFGATTLYLNGIKEKTCLQNKSKFITEDQFVQHMNITIK